MKTVYKVSVCEDQNIGVCLCENTQNVNVSLDVTIGQQSHSSYDGPYRVTPLAFSETTLDTSNKTLHDDLVVEEIPYYETSNVSGYTIYIG